MMKTIFFDVDTQNDFIYPDGALYVPGAETLIPNFEKIIRCAHLWKIPIWGSIDAHLPGDPELKRNNGTFDDHCMLGQKGQEKIAATRPANPLWIPYRPASDEELKRLGSHPGEVYFQKQSIYVFDIPVIRAAVAPFENAVVFGVATDYCVLTAALGFRELGKQVYIVTDAIKPVNLEPADGEKALRRMQAAGAVFTNTERVCSGSFFPE